MSNPRACAQVNRAVAQIDAVTQQNAASSETSASSAEELNAQASMLQTAVHDLLALVGSQKTTREETTLHPPAAHTPSTAKSVPANADAAVPV